MDLGVSIAKLAGWEAISHPQCHPNADGVVLRAALGQWQVLLKRSRVKDFSFLVYKTQNSEDLGLTDLF